MARRFSSSSTYVNFILNVHSGTSKEGRASATMGGHVAPFHVDPTARRQLRLQLLFFLLMRARHRTADVHFNSAPLPTPRHTREHLTKR